MTKIRNRMVFVWIRIETNADQQHWLLRKYFLWVFWIEVISHMDWNTILFTKKPSAVPGRDLNPGPVLQ